MYRILSAALVLAISVGGFAAPVIIDDFEDIDDPANWQVNLTAGHTLNATVTGNVPDYATSGTDNLAGLFKATWETAAPTSSPVNFYDPSGSTTYWGVRFNINAPTSLPNNAIPTATGLLEADMINQSSYPVKVALVVDSAASSQLERGPFIDIAAGDSFTYSWDFATVAPVGFDTGDGEFSGSVQRVKSLLVYSPVAPTASALSFQVDNIRNGSAVPIERPEAPNMLSLLQGASVGEAIVSWDAVDDSVTTGFNIYVASDANFNSNQLTYPSTPEMTVGGSARSATLTGLSTGENVFVTVSATNGVEETMSGQTLAANLKANAGTPDDLLVLDNDDYAPGSLDFETRNYGQAAVYTAMAEEGLLRTFQSATAGAIATGTVALLPSDEGIVIWSNLNDGAAGESISLDNLGKISTFLDQDGNLIISGTNVAEDLAARDPLLLGNFQATLVDGDLGVSDITPVRSLDMAESFSTSLNPMTFPVAYATTQNDALLPTTLSIEQALYTGVPRNGGVPIVGYNRQVLFLGFAFETIGDPDGASATQTLRQNLLSNMIQYLLAPPTAAQDWQLFSSN